MHTNYHHPLECIRLAMTIAKATLIIQFCQALRQFDSVSGDCALLYHQSPRITSLSRADREKCGHWFEIRDIARNVQRSGRSLPSNFCLLNENDFTSFILKSLDASTSPVSSGNVHEIIDEVNQLCGDSRGKVERLSAAWLVKSETDKFEYCDGLYRKIKAHHLLPEDDRYKCGIWYVLRQVVDNVTAKDFSLCLLDVDDLTLRILNAASDYSFLDTHTIINQVKNHISNVCDFRRPIAHAWTALSLQEQDGYCATHFDNSAGIYDLADQWKCRKLDALRNEVYARIGRHHEMCNLPTEELNLRIIAILKLQVNSIPNTLENVTSHLCSRINAWYSLPESERFNYCLNHFNKHDYAYKLARLDQVKCLDFYDKRTIAKRVLIDHKDNDLCKLGQKALEGAIQESWSSEADGQNHMEVVIHHILDICARAAAWATWPRDERFEYCATTYEDTSVVLPTGEDKFRCRKWFELRGIAKSPKSGYAKNVIKWIRKIARKVDAVGEIIGSIQSTS